jgi:hypothetical protein
LRKTFVVYFVAATCENGVAVLRCKTRPQTIIRVLYVARRLGLPLLTQWRPGLRAKEVAMATSKTPVGADAEPFILKDGSISLRRDGSTVVSLTIPPRPTTGEAQYDRLVTRLLELALDWSRRDG